MDTNSGVKFDVDKYNSGELNRPTSAPSYTSATVIKYIASRVIGPSFSNSFQGSTRGAAWSNVGLSSTTAGKTESLGLASLVQNSIFSTFSSTHSIDGERIIDEYRELSKVTETLASSMLQCSNLEAHNRALELQIEWLEKHRQQDGFTIEKMFRTEMDSARKLTEENLHQKPILETKVTDTERRTLSYDEQYQQLLAKRNTSSKELFDLERQIAQNNAESQFLHRRIFNLEDESKFYRLKNNGLHSRKVRLSYELDEEIFSQQSLKSELEILENDKITNEDTQSASIDDVRNSLDLSQVAGMQSPRHYFDQLNHHVQHIRTDYEKKMEVYREELHRKFELELHRYQIQKSRPTPGVSREHELKLEKYQQEQKDVTQQTSSVHERINETIIEIKTIERQLVLESNGPKSISNLKRHLSMLNQLIQDREGQLNEAMRIRTALKQQVDGYRERLNRYSRQTTQNNFKTRSSFQEMNQSYTSRLSFNRNSTFRSSLKEFVSENNQQEFPSTPRAPPAIVQSTSYLDFNIDQDCEELHRILNESNIDEVAIIRILCNRSDDQRQQIRDKYKNRFNHNLDGDLELITNGISLNKLLRLILLSPIERDCYELRRILKGAIIDENILAEIVFSRSNKHIQTVRDSYHKLFQNKLEQDIIGARENPTKRIFLALIQSNRPDDNVPDDSEVLNDARHLYETGAKWRTEGSTFVRLLCTRSNTQLKQIFATYQQFSQVDIEQAIKVQIDGDLYYTLMAIVRIIRNRPRFFAYELKKCLRGTNTNEDNLNRLIVSRCEIDMIQIKNEYERISKRTLYDHIQTDTNGNYKRALIELLNQRIEPNTRELTSQNSNGLIDVLKRQNSEKSSVQWREPISRVSSDSFVNRTSIRSSSARTINETTRNGDNQSMRSHFNGQFDSNNQGKRTSLLTITTRSSRSQYTDRRPSGSLPRVFGNNS